MTPTATIDLAVDPLRLYFEANRDVTGSVAFNGDVLRPMCQVQTAARHRRRIEGLGLAPHDGSLSAEQFVTVWVDESDLRNDARFALVADALSDLDIPPIVIEQTQRAQEL